MKPFSLILTTCAGMLLITSSANAQRPESRERERDRDRDREEHREREEHRDGGERRERETDRGPDREGARRFPTHPLVMALDVNKDGEISEREIRNASAALRKLDKNEDGKLTRQELRPAGAPGREGGRFGGPPPFEGERRGPGAPRDRERPEGRPERSAGSFVDRIMQNDKNEDGKISKKEMPERLSRIFDRLDANEDGYVSRKEAENMAQRFRENSRRDREGSEEGRPRPRRPEAE